MDGLEVRRIGAGVHQEGETEIPRPWFHEAVRRNLGAVAVGRGVMFTLKGEVGGVAVVAVRDEGLAGTEVGVDGGEFAGVGDRPTAGA